MNPIASAAITSIIRWALAFGAGLLVQHGVWTQGDATTYVTAAALALVALGWSLWEKYKSRVKFMAALSMPLGATENDVTTRMASGFPIPSITTPPNTVPGVPKQTTVTP